MRSSLARHTLAYGATNAISSAIPTLVGPILTHYLTPTDYGISAVFIAAFNFLGPLSGMGVQTAFRRRYYEKETYHYPSYIYSATIWSLVQLAFITLGATLTYRWWGTEVVSYVWSLTLFPWVGGRYLSSIAAAQLQMQKKPLGYGILTWSGNLLNVAGSLLFVIGFGYGWEGRVLGQVIASVGIGVASIWVLRRLVGTGATFRREYAKDAMEFGAPTVPYALMDRAMRFGDRTLIAAMVNLEQAGFYALGAQVCNLLTQGWMSLNQAFQPWLFEHLEQDTPRAKRKVMLAIYAMSAILMSSGVGLWLAVRWVFPFVIGDKFMDALEFVPWLCIGFSFRGIAGIFSQLIIFSKETKELTKIAMTVGFLNLGGEVLLIWRFGAQGAAWATCFAYFVNMLMVWSRARKLIPIPGI
ncbi:MAG TPA: oligosaccharide flippase family protein [Polyangiaceae bacterium]|jgi:O-antigen/teichoic acid export membrane protein|nr:oligosaccharide flippase family protein [Polyangiaceae bacterium]